MAENDGFIVSGSGFSYAGKRYVLLGDPGCGKTRFLIQAFERGAKIFGDSELYLFKSGEISGLFKNVEVRYPTVFHTHLWHSLSAVQKGYLFFCHCLSAATFRMISLNLSLPNLVSRFSQEENLSGEPVVFVHIGGGRPVSKLTPEAFIEEITGYEKRCWNSYGEFIFSQTDFAKARESMREIFGKATLWKAPLNTTIDQILTLS